MSLPRAAAVGLGLGAAWGVLARVWMRLISTDPEFSWSGTVAIVVLAALLGTGVAIAHAAGRSGRSGWWKLTMVPGLLLFMSPGMLLAPCFLLGGLAWGTRGRGLRAVGFLALAGSLAVGGWVQFGVPTTEDVVTVGAAVVFGAGYVAMATTLAWAGSVLWRRPAKGQRGHDAAAPAADGALGLEPSGWARIGRPSYDSSRSVSPMPPA